MISQADTSYPDKVKGYIQRQENLSAEKYVILLVSCYGLAPFETGVVSELIYASAE